MTAGRMAGHVNPVGVATVFPDVGSNPGDGIAGLPYLLSHVDGRDKPVIDDDGAESGCHETERHIRAIGLVVADPVPAVNVDLHRRQARLLRTEDVEPLTAAR